MSGPGDRAQLCLALETSVCLLLRSTLCPRACWQYLGAEARARRGQARSCLALETERSYVWPWKPPFVCCCTLRFAQRHADSFPLKMLVPGCRGQSPAGTKLFLFGLCLAL